VQCPLSFRFVSLINLLLYYYIRSVANTNDNIPRSSEVHAASAFNNSVAKMKLIIFMSMDESLVAAVGKDSGVFNVLGLCESAACKRSSSEKLASGIETVAFWFPLTLTFCFLVYH
jgi:hypothetical protein